MRNLFYAGLVTTIIILISIPAFAKYDITPSISIKELYNDNIFLDSSDEEDDFITIISPEIKLDYSPSKEADFSLFYGLNYKYYSQHNNLNDDSIKETQDIYFEAQIRPYNFIFIDVSDYYSKVPIDIRKKSARDNEHENMTDSNVFFVSPSMILPLTSTITTTIGYGYTNTWHNKSEETVDSDKHSIFLSLEKKFSPRINGLIKYSYIAYRPESADEQDSTSELRYDRHEGSVAVDYRITADLKVNAGVGRAWFDYKEDDNKSFIFWNFDTDYILKISSESSLEVFYRMSFIDSITGGAIKRDKIGSNFKTGKVLKLSVEPYYMIDEHINRDREDEVAGVVVDLSRPLTKRISATLSGELEEINYSPQDESSYGYSIGGILDYTLSKDIAISLGYRYNHRDASADIDSGDIEINDFDNNILWLQAKVAF